MKNIAIICEYNLFHSGHLRQLEKIRAMYPGSVVTAVMSGDFVQRGDVGAVSKYQRAKAAALCGVDLTLELPPPWSFSCAELFASGAVKLIRALGVFDGLCFGSESGELTGLQRIARRLGSEEFQKAFSEELDGADSYIRSRDAAYQRLYGEALGIPPNDILGVEYLSAIDEYFPGLEPIIVRREGNESATLSRKYFGAGELEQLSRIVPDRALEVYRSSGAARLSNLGRIMLYTLRSSPKLSGIFGAGGGVGEYILSRAQKASSFDEFLTSLPAKTASAARMRRTALNIMLGVTDDAPKKAPAYTTLLSADKAGCALLREIKHKSGFPIVTKPSDAVDIPGAEAKVQRKFAQKCETLYELAFDEPLPRGKLLESSPYIAI